MLFGSNDNWKLVLVVFEDVLVMCSKVIVNHEVRSKVYSKVYCALSCQRCYQNTSSSGRMLEGVSEGVIVNHEGQRCVLEGVSEGVIVNHEGQRCVLEGVSEGVIVNHEGQRCVVLSGQR